MASQDKALSFRAAALIQLVSKYASILVGLVVTAVLSRLLTPDDFGVVAIVTVFTAFFAIFADMGVGTAVVQYRDLTVEDYEKLFTFSLCLALGLSGVFAAISPLIVLFYNNEALQPLLLWAIPSLFCNTLNMVPNGLMLKGKRFRAIGVRLVVMTVLSGIAGCAAAALGAGPYALIIQTNLSALGVFLWNWIASPIRHLNRHFMGPLKLIFSYSSFQFAFTAVNYFSRNLDNLLIGKVFGDGPLAYYDKAYKLTTYPINAFSGIIANIVQPFMAEHQDHPEVIWDFWFRVTKLISVVGAVIAAVFFASSREIVLLFYGSQWEPAVPLFSVLAITVYFQMLGNSTGGFYQSLGRTDLMFKVGLVNTSITVVMLILGLSSGSLFITACCIAVAFVAHIACSFGVLILRGFRGKLSVLVRLLPEICTAVVAAGAATFVGTLIPSGLWIQAIVKTAVVGAIMLAGYALTGQMKYVKMLVH